MFQLDLKSRESMYTQVVNNLKELIILKVLKPDEKLPSVRELSKTLTVNPNTVQKAYRQLEQQGYIYTVSGLGTFVSKKEDRKIDEIFTRNMFFNLEKQIKELLYTGTSSDEILEFTERLLSDFQPA